jgi:hypothetical protein
MLVAASIGWWRSTPGWFSSRRRVRRLRRFNRRWRLAFTRRPPACERLGIVKYLDCSQKPEGVSSLRASISLRLGLVVGQGRTVWFQ